MKKVDPGFGLGTLMNHYQEHDHPEEAHLGPIYQTSSFAFSSMVSVEDTFKGVDKQHYVYTRGRNPNAIQLAKKIALLEGIDLLRSNPAQDPEEVVGAYCTASGMSAITATVISRLEAGDHIVTHTSLYSGTHKLFTEICPRFGITVSVVDGTDLNQWRQALEEHPNTGLLYVETPSNPRIDVYDLEKLTRLAHEHNAWIAVDNTAATPFHQRPLTWGCDVVIHSTTKYLNGHGSAVGGVVVSSHPQFADFWGKLGQTAIELGATPSPNDCWLTLLGLRTFDLRMSRHSENAQTVAEFLSQHPKIDQVLYPGLVTNPYHELASKQMVNGFGGFLSFEIKGGKKETHRFVEALSLATLAISFGSTDTVVQVPTLMTHSGLSQQEREAANIGDNLVRYCVGVENQADILNDLDRALAVI